MPALVPEPTYGADTPEVHDFYARLTAGLTLTLDGEAAERQAFIEEADALQPDVDAARAEFEAAEAVLGAATAALAALEGGPRPWKGWRGLRADVAAAAGQAATASAALHEAEVHRGRAVRQALLRVGATRPRAALQNGALPVGPAAYGVYAFYDYDGHALYVGKTTEGLSVRVRRHLTNQRTDAVGMSVLDPLEVVEVEVWPIWPGGDTAAAKALIDGLEYAVEQSCIEQGSTLFNEKRIVPVPNPPPIPASVRFDVLSPEFRERLGHPDLRIARRLAIAARLGSRIAERSLRTIGLRRSLQRQLARLNALADARFVEVGGEAAVPIDQGQDDEG